MLQEPWEGSVLASILAFFLPLDSGVHLLIPRIEGPSVGQSDHGGALLSHSIPQTTFESNPRSYLQI